MNMRYVKLQALLVTLCIAVPLLIGCAAKLPTGRIEFHPSLAIKEKGAETVIIKTDTDTDSEADAALSTKGEYSRKDDKLKFENEDVTVVLKEARKYDNGADGAVFTILYDREFVLLKMSITNKSESKKVRYDPAITALLDSDLGYAKPLDYPSLYEMAMKDGALEKGLTAFRSSFYDLGITVLPLQTLSRYIIFRPISKGAKRAKLVIKNMYTGTKTIDLTFEFFLTEANESGK